MLHFLVLLYVALIYVRPGEIVPALAPIPFLNYVSILAALVGGLSLLFQPRAFWNQPHDKFFLLFWFAILISNPAWGWFGGFNVALAEFAPVVMGYFLIRLGVRNVPELRRFTRLFVWLNVLLAFNGLLQIYTGAGLGQVEAMSTREGIRIQGTGIFNDPNDLGMTLVMAVPFILSSVMSRDSRFFARLFGLAGLSVLLMACYYTNSRGTILGLGVVFAAYAYRRFGFVSASSLATVGLAALLLFAPSRMSTVSAEEESAQGRIQAWAAGYQMFVDSPVTGIGYHRFGDLYGLVAHNSFVHVLGELGLLGATAFVGMFFWALIALRNKDPAIDKTNSLELKLRRDLSDSTIGMLLCMVFLSRSYVIVPFIAVALSACCASLSAADGVKPETVRSRAIAVVALTCGITVFFYVIARLLSFYS